MSLADLFTLTPELEKSNTIVSFGILHLEVLDKGKELLAAPLLKEPHKVRLECLGVGGRNFLNFVATLADPALLLNLEHIGAVDACLSLQLLFHSRYLETRVLSRILTSFPPLMIYLGIRSMFQSRFWPSSGGGFFPGRNSFHRLVRFRDAPSPP